MKETGRSEKGAGFYERMYSENPMYHPYTSPDPPAPHKFDMFKWWRRLGKKALAHPGVIDLGSGPGTFAEYLCRLGVYAYEGLDFSHIAIEAGRRLKTGGRLRPAFVFNRFDLNEIKRSDLKAFSYRITGGPVMSESPYERPIIFAIALLEHLDQDLRLLEEIPEHHRLIALVPDFDEKPHVRIFEQEEELEDRYGHLFESPDVYAFTRPLKGGRARRMFILDGIRKSGDSR